MPPSAFTTAPRLMIGPFQSGMVEKLLPGLLVGTTKAASVPVPPVSSVPRNRTTASAARRSSLLVVMRSTSRYPFRTGAAPTAPRGAAGPPVGGTAPCSGSAARLPREGGSRGEPLHGVGVDHRDGELVRGARRAGPGRHGIGQARGVGRRVARQGAVVEDASTEAAVVRRVRDERGAVVERGGAVGPARDRQVQIGGHRPGDRPV